MLIIAIAWIYVVALMAFAEASFIAGLATFLLYGLGPLAIVLWLFGTPERRRRRQRRSALSDGYATPSESPISEPTSAPAPLRCARSDPPSGHTPDRGESSSSAPDR